METLNIRNVVIEKTRATDKAQNNSFVYTVTQNYLKHLDK